MMNLSPTKPMRIHFIGICGVAMSALALAFKAAGNKVTGSDVGFYPPVSTNLKAGGVEFYPGWHPDLMIKDGIPNVVVVGNVAGSSNPELRYALEHNLVCHSYPEIIREEFVKKNSIVCAGTYGKSTSTTLLTWILSENKFDPTYMFGSIAQNQLPPAKLTKSNWSILEGDEYKASRSDLGPKFAYYSPTHLLLTSVVWDHADIYPTEQSYRDVFQKLVDSLPERALAVISEKAQPILNFRDRKIISYGKSAGNTYAYTNVTQSHAGVSFEIRHGQEVFRLTTSCLGEYMADNITGCFALAHAIGIKPENIIKAVKSFSGVKRRLEKRFEGSVTVFDDIAHSPSKAQAVLASLKAVYSQKILAVFEPNSGNRELAAAPGYAHAFRDADEIIIPRLTKIKIDATKPSPLDGEALAKIISATHPAVTCLPEDANLITHLKQKTRPGDVIIFLGSHGWRGMIEHLIEELA